jgi:hypothetical protein
MGASIIKLNSEFEDANDMNRKNIFIHFVWD